MDKRLVALFVALLALVIGRGLMLSRNLSELDAHQVAVRERDHIAASVADLISLVKDAETGQRGYLITGDTSYLEPYRSALVSLGQREAELSRLASSDRTLAAQITRLHGHVASKLRELADTISVRSNQGFDAARDRVLDNEGTRTMDELLAEAASLIREQDERRASLRASAEAMVGRTRGAILVSTIVFCLIAVVFFIELRRSALQRSSLVHKAETALQQEAEARALADRASRAKDEFLATLSHELRTPLNAVLSWTALMRMESSDASILQRGLEIIERNARSQARLIDDLLDMSRIVSGKTRLTVTEVQLQPILASVVDIVRPGADAKGVGLHTTIDSRAGNVSGDPERIRQVLWNLLSNAITFTPKSGHVDVRLEQTNSHVEIVVSDTGQGIDASFLPHIFDRFRQADSTTTRAHGGLGLGLAIAKHLVELHGGTIRATSDGKGRGATFIVTLPVRGFRVSQVQRDGRADETPSTPSGLPALTGVRVLAVDDHGDTLDMVRMLLTHQGALVETAGNVADGLQVFGRWRPDVLVVDISMPGRDGFDLITTVRAFPAEQGGRTPAIALTAFARPEDRIRVLAAGFQLHLAKPADPTELIVSVASLTDQLESSQRAGA